MTTHYLPPEIAKVFSKIMAAIEPAKRTAETQNEDGSKSAYAGVDDIYAALQREMAKAGLVCEMLDGGVDINSIFEIGGGRVGFHLKFIPCWTLVAPGAKLEPDEAAAEHGAEIDVKSEATDRYENPKAVIHVVVDLAGGSQAMLAARTNAERTYLKNLFKITSAPGAATAEGEKPAPQAAPPSAAEIDDEPSRMTPRKPRRPQYPLMMSKDESESTRAAFLDSLTACGSSVEIDTLFKRLDFGRLQAIDQGLVKAAMAKRENELTAAAA